MARGWMVVLVGLLAGSATAGPAADAVEHADPVEELGAVRWPRGLEAAQARASTSGKPVLVLFDEVPGCSTVKGFGNGALSHPLLAEAVETLFEPVLVYNNRTEDDAICEAFAEPRWNNPVVRVLGKSRPRDERFAGPYTEAAFAGFLVTALDRRGKAPVWLRALAEELEGAGRAEEATYAMSCFWSGEAHLGEVDGVLSTETGWQGGREVVRLTYDPRRTSVGELDDHAEGHASRVSSGELRRTPKDDLHALRGTRWADVEMTPGQASKVNAWVADGKDPSRWLSPRQLSE